MDLFIIPGILLLSLAITDYKRQAANERAEKIQQEANCERAKLEQGIIHDRATKCVPERSPLK